ncbi:MAG: COQ9 family protein [Alphaproteobacteria bacterium]|nr:COQ9 family protein [Alphaproteobacteria bacterium]
MTPLPDDPTLDEVRAYLAPRLAGHAAFDGWNRAALVSAAHEASLDPAMVALAFSGGATDMIDAWFEWLDNAMVRVVSPDMLSAQKVREKITTLIEARLELLAPNREALRRAQAILAMPQNLPKAGRLGWRAADQMWRLAGDSTTDFNHYSKRVILAGVYAATLLVFLSDESGNWTETRAFLARRIDGIIRFEKAKGQWQARAERRPSLARFVGRLRYPAI